ncbi:hypothetical protein IKQ21_09545 [bacterium]|nr:hypothetical protein [bacterium]
MRVQPISQQNSTSFGKIYAKTKKFSAEQKEISNLITKEFAKRGKSMKTFAEEYEKYGFNFILKPLENNLLSLEATNKFSVLKWFFQKDYSDKRMFHIGVYNKEAAKYVLNDLEYNKALFKFVNLSVKDCLN